MSTPVRRMTSVWRWSQAFAHRWEPERIFVILTAYLDESGTHGGSPVTVMAGMLANARQWKAFERNFQRLKACVCVARIARSIYTLRNKRNIAHKNEVDPNTFDLAYIHHASSWIMAEFIRTATGISMEGAGRLIELVQAPVDDLVEEIDGTRIIHADVNIKTEVMILLRSHHPDRVALDAIKSALSRRNPGTLGNQIRELIEEKYVDGNSKKGYRLTQPGYRLVSERIRQLRAAA
jgi:Protein of unknown function (DUF3800)